MSNEKPNLLQMLAVLGAVRVGYKMSGDKITLHVHSDCSGAVYGESQTGSLSGGDKPVHLFSFKDADDLESLIYEEIGEMVIENKIKELDIAN